MHHNQRVHMIVHGRVHGVTFRESTRIEASKLGLVGLVRNLMDGAVEIIAEGPRDILDRLVKWAHIGPPACSVDRVEVAYNEPTGEFVTFDINFGF
ncbi:MAG: acylphosphatase [bacterium]